MSGGVEAARVLRSSNLAGAGDERPLVRLKGLRLPPSYLAGGMGEEWMEEDVMMWMLGVEKAADRSRPLWCRWSDGCRECECEE